MQLDEGEDDADGGPSPEGGYWFDPWLTTDRRIPNAIAENLTGSYVRETSASRQRGLKRRDRENLNAIIHAIVMNLAFAALDAAARPPVIAISLREKGLPKKRYSWPGIAGVQRVFEWLSEEAGTSLLTLQKSRSRGTASTIIVAQQFVAGVREWKLKPEHFRKLAGEELIRLSDASKDYVEDSTDRYVLDYRDTPVTDAFRAEMVRINTTLAAAKITLADHMAGDPILSPPRLLRSFRIEPPLRLPRSVRRKGPPKDYVERFDLGGRLIGGWWQSLPKRRRSAVRIDGEPVADLDYASMYLRLAYCRAGVEPPGGDLYAVPSFETPEWRKTIKGFVNAMLARETPLTKSPKGLGEHMPRKVTAAAVRSAILAAHPALAGVFESGRYLNLMFLESQVLVAALIRLADQGVPALPMHDGLMVARSQSRLARDAMKAAAVQVVGYLIPITEETYDHHYTPPIPAQ